MALQISPKDSDLLLKQKNVLSDDVLGKYRRAGEIAQTCLKYIVSLINESYHLGQHEPYSAAELCLLGDSFMQTLVNKSFKKINEKGIAQPVTLDVNQIAGGYSPELNDDKGNLYFKPGDVVTVSLGCHIDGYTANVAHSVVIYPPGTSAPGPLLGESADAVCASYLATESVITLLACALTPEKIPNAISEDKKVTGTMIRNLVNGIAESFNCAVVPTSKVRRVRRFLAGQAEGVVAERDFKGVVWSESDQERALLEKSAANSERQIAVVDATNGRNVNENPDNAIPSDDFVVLPGEVYLVDIKMSPLDKSEPGFITLESLDGTVKLNEEFNPKPSIYIRDVSITEQLKLRNSRRLLSLVDKKQSVYPFKLAYVSEGFPLKADNDGESIITQLQKVESDVKVFKFGLQECVNKTLFDKRPILATKFIPLKEVLKLATATGVNGYDASNPTLPGLELPLPKLGVTALKLRTALKHGVYITNARHATTVALSNERGALRLGGGADMKVSFVHSAYQLEPRTAAAVTALAALAMDERFGVKVGECRVLAETVAAAEAVADTMEE
ncbi:hypothetical protein CANINC_000594 [Pichia inconspicua]|uniref:Probable metalloprotease ARX1 n=1 Tax=Pichia inconspicua TaxID=52247 RepID=A0A4T0X5V0_9ASCO|nr:hypothetical protein CANINC_000594 [[Candida] inconspicua]